MERTTKKPWSSTLLFSKVCKINMHPAASGQTVRTFRKSDFQIEWQAISLPKWADNTENKWGKRWDLSPVPLDSGNGRGYNTKVKSCAEEEYLFFRHAEKGRLVKALAGNLKKVASKLCPGSYSMGRRFQPLLGNECGPAPKFRWYHGQFCSP